MPGIRRLPAGVVPSRGASRPLSGVCCRAGAGGRISGMPSVVDADAAVTHMVMSTRMGGPPADLLAGFGLPSR